MLTGCVGKWRCLGGETLYRVPAFSMCFVLTTNGDGCHELLSLTIQATLVSMRT